MRMGLRAVAAGMVFLLGGCTALVGSGYENASDEVAALAPKDVKTESTPAMKQLTVDRIAVMPVVDDPPKGGEPLGPGAADAITAELYSQAALAGGWQVVPQDDVMQALQNAPPTTIDDMDVNALVLGRLVSADGVLYGSVERYQERQGIEDSSARPVAVTFFLKFLDMKSKQVVWTSKFAKKQKSLPQSLTQLFNFVQKQGRWAHAQELAQTGVEQSVADLHRHLTFVADSKHFETGTYGQLKSGQQRYNVDNGKAGLY